LHRDTPTERLPHNGHRADVVRHEKVAQGARVGASVRCAADQPGRVPFGQPACPAVGYD